MLAIKQDSTVQITMEEAIKILEYQRDFTKPSEENKVALDMAVKQMKKTIPAKPIDRGKWHPKTCPSCGTELSQRIGNGRYRDSIFLVSCGKCRQLLDWD